MHPMLASQVKTLVVLASQLSGYPVPNEEVPLVMEVTANEMAADVCDNELFCGIVGYFQHAEDAADHKVHVVVRMDAEQSANAIAIHELTHWLQYKNWPDHEDRSCPHEFLREYQAYRADMAYQIVYENKPIPKVFEIPPTVCMASTSTPR